MSFRFLRLNVSRSGLSAAVGRRGLSVTAGKRGTYLNAGVSGTGLSARDRFDATTAPDDQAPPVGPRQPVVRRAYVFLLLAAVAALVIALR